MKKSAFSLSEVLIALVIIGIIAALTVPFLINNTNKHEFRSAIKKAIASVNQALKSEYATEGLTATDFVSAELLVENLFKKRMNVISDQSVSEFTSSECNGNSKIFITSDGFIFCVSNYSSANSDEENVPCNYGNTTPCVEQSGPNLWIDVNGLKKPNILTTSSSNPKDIYQAQIYSQKVVPYGNPTQEVMYGKKKGVSGNTPGSTDPGNSGDNTGDSGSTGNAGNDKPGIEPPNKGTEPTPPDVEPTEPDIPDSDNPWYDRWDPNKWPSFRDFLKWIRDVFGGIFG